MKLKKMRYKPLVPGITAAERATDWLSDPANIARAGKITIRAAAIEAGTNVASMNTAALLLDFKFKPSGRI